MADIPRNKVSSTFTEKWLPAAQQALHPAALFWQSQNYNFSLYEGEFRSSSKCGEQMPQQPPNDRRLAIKVVMMPRDTNPHGTIFGGVLLSYIDQAGAIGASDEMRSSGWSEKLLVSVAMKSVEFLHPVFVGDVVSFWTTLVRVGTTSITMHVDVEADRGGEPEKLTEAEVTYVAVDLSGNIRRPVPIRDE